MILCILMDKIITERRRRKLRKVTQMIPFLLPCLQHDQLSPKVNFLSTNDSSLMEFSEVKSYLEEHLAWITVAHKYPPQDHKEV